MRVADRIRKLGFRRWYERQLIEAHGSLVTAFLGVIVVAVCMDQFHWHDPGFKPLIMLALIIAGIALCFKTVAFYFKVLFRAEHYATQATCSDCGVYGVIEVLASPAHSTQEIDHVSGGDWMKVRCKKCGHDWTMRAMQAGEPDKKHL